MTRAGCWAGPREGHMDTRTRQSSGSSESARQPVLSRRELLRRSGATLGFAAGFPGLNSLVPRASFGQDKLTTEHNRHAWGGSFADAVKEASVVPFEKETGVKVTMGVTGNPAQMLALLKAGSLGGASTIDLMWQDLTFSYSAIKQELVEPLRLENIPS